MDASRGRPKSVRRFSLLDGMILVATFAAGLAPLCWADPDFFEWSEVSDLLASTWDMDLVQEVLALLLVLAVPVAATSTLGVLALRLRPPRPRRRLLVRQPGTVACLAAVLGGASASAFAVVNVLSVGQMIMVPAGSIPYAHDPRNWLTTFAFLGPIGAGFAVAVAWSTQALVGRWRSEPCWLDRLGRLVGLVWLAMGLAGLFVMRTLTN